MGADFVCAGVLTYYLKQCSPCGGGHPRVPVHGRSHSLLCGLEGQALFSVRESALTANTKITMGVSGDSEPQV